MKKNILNQKNCFLSGATGGLGEQLAIQLAYSNCNIFMTSRNKKNLKGLKNKLESINKNIQIFYCPGDLSNLSELKRVVKLSRQKFNTIDILINTAGVFPVKFLSKTTLEDFDTCFNLNVKAPFLLTKEFSKDMIKNRWGRIINIGSSSAYEGFEETAIYCASKHAILGLSRSLQKELKNHNIRTFCISPGSIKTKMGRKVRGQNFKTFIDPKEIAEFIIYIISFDKKMIAEEIRLNRMIIK